MKYESGLVRKAWTGAAFGHRLDAKHFMSNANGLALCSLGSFAKSPMAWGTWLFPALTLALLVAGCSTEPAKPSTNAPASAPPAPTAAPVATPAAPTAQTAPVAKDPYQEAAAKAPAEFEGEGWQDLFDGQTLTGWKETAFSGHGEVEIRFGLLTFSMGDPFTGVNLTNEFPTMNYEIALDALRVMGSDFFCGLTIPVRDSHCSLIVGGWGGSLVGISSIGGLDASENETTKFMRFESHQWYRIRLRVTEGRIEGWINNDKLIDVETEDKRISVRPGEIELSKPLGLACWQTAAAYREIKWRRMTTPASPKKRY
jgi:hypothetical protein